MKLSLRKIVSAILVVMMTVSCLAVIPAAVADGAPVLDGVKDSSYTEDKMTASNTAFAGAGGAQIKNTTNVSWKTYYQWDDDYNYVFIEMYDPDDKNALELFYYCNNPVGSQSIFSAVGGGYVQWDGATLTASDETNMTKAMVAGDGVNYYEFKFPRAKGSTGFAFNTVGYITDKLDVSYGIIYYYFEYAKVVLYDDDSTWADTSKYTPPADPNTPSAIDGVKDGCFTDARMTVSNTAFAGNGGAITENTTKVSWKTYYSWDDNYNYVFIEMNDPDGECPLDLFYYCNNPVGSGYLFQATGGGYVQWDGSSLTASADDIEKAMTTAKGVRNYEFKFPRAKDSTGIIFNTVALVSDSLDVSYGIIYNNFDYSKAVLYADNSTWKDTTKYTAPVDPNAPTAIDGVKDSCYVTGKMTASDTAFAGNGGAIIENTTNVSWKTYYSWDAEYNYVFIEMNDPDGECPLDLFYYCNNPVGNGYMFQAAGGGYVQWDGSNLTASADDMVKAMTTDTGVRNYEFKFPRAKNSTGFIFNTVALVGDSLDVSYGIIYNMFEYAKAVLYDDNTTWKDTTKYSQVITPDDPPVGPVNDLGVDCVKDERYTDDKCTTISKAYMGSGGADKVNEQQVYTKTWYNWDDDYNYLYVEIHTPIKECDIDIIYYCYDLNINAGINNIFQQAAGGYLQRTPDGTIITSDENLIYSCNANKPDLHIYEFALPRAEESPGFMFSPVAYVNSTYVVAYNCTYYLMAGVKTVAYDNPNSFLDNTKVDPDVLIDFTVVDELNGELAKLPADASTLTMEDKDLVFGVHDRFASVPAGWIPLLDQDLYARLEPAYQKIISLDTSKDEEIAAIAEEIGKLPKEITLRDKANIKAIRSRITALGDYASKLESTVLNNLVVAEKALAGLGCAVIVDGKLDDIYESGIEAPIEMEFNQTSFSNCIGIDPETRGYVYTVADSEYTYFYVRVFDDDKISVPDGKTFSDSSVFDYDNIITYMDMDPSNQPLGVPYQDAGKPDCTNFYFYVTADGYVHTMFTEKGAALFDPNSFAFFTEEDGYGYELRLPRVEGEESVIFNMVISDPQLDGSGNIDPVESRLVAIGGEWAYNYNQHAEIYYEDLPLLLNYVELEEAIAKMPEASTLLNTDYEYAIQNLRNAYNALRPDMQAQVSQAALDHLAALEARMEELKSVTYGDLNNDNKTDASDALIVLKAAVKKVTLDANQTTAADVNGDKKVDASDALLILKKAVHKIDRFPVEN